MSGTDVDALVCGAGVAGLAAACALGRLGWRVLVADRAPAPSLLPKGEVLQPASLDTLAEWGARARLDEAGAVPLSRLALYDARGAALMALDYGTLPPDPRGGRRHLLTQDYPTLLAALTASLPDGVEIRRGTAVEGPLLDPGSGRVTGVRLADGAEVRARLVVAADGISSRLRRAVGIAAPRAEYPHRLVSFELPGGRPERPELSVYATDRGMRLVYPLPDDRVRLYVQVHPDELRAVGRDGMQGWARRMLEGTPALASLAEPLLAGLHRRQVFGVCRFTAPRLAVPGLALVGDAAHCVHPMAAQGANTAIADAARLAAHLAATTAGADADGVDAALRAYQGERAPALTHTDRTSHNAARMVTATSPAVRRLGWRAARRTGADPRLAHTVTSNMSGLGAVPLTVRDRLRQLGLLPLSSAPPHRGIETA